MQAESQGFERETSAAGRSRAPTLIVLTRGANESCAVPVHELKLAQRRDLAEVIAPANSSNGFGWVTAASEAVAGNSYYAAGPGPLISGAPVVERAPQAADRGWPRLSAKELIAELHSINTQVQRIMFQVDRAVARLATTS